MTLVEVVLGVVVAMVAGVMVAALLSEIITASKLEGSCKVCGEDADAVSYGMRVCHQCRLKLLP